jgi:hypothetical protein
MHDMISGGGPVAATEPPWTDVAGFWVSLAAAVATFAAVIVSLWIAFRAGRQGRASRWHARMRVSCSNSSPRRRMHSTTSRPLTLSSSRDPMLRTMQPRKPSPVLIARGKL